MRTTDGKKFYQYTVTLRTINTNNVQCTNRNTHFYVPDKEMDKFSETLTTQGSDSRL